MSISGPAKDIVTTRGGTMIAAEGAGNFRASTSLENALF